MAASSMANVDYNLKTVHELRQQITAILIKGSTKTHGISGAFFSNRDNIPQWWKDTDIRWCSVNETFTYKGPDGDYKSRKLHKAELVLLLQSYDQFQQKLIDNEEVADTEIVAPKVQTSGCTKKINVHVQTDGGTEKTDHNIETACKQVQTDDSLNFLADKEKHLLQLERKLLEKEASITHREEMVLEERKLLNEDRKILIEERKVSIAERKSYVDLQQSKRSSTEEVEEVDVIQKCATSQEQYKDKDRWKNLLLKLSACTDFDSLHVLAKQIDDKLPAVTWQKVNIPAYSVAKKYKKFCPTELLPHEVPKDGNCLFSSVSQLLWNHQDGDVFLRLKAAIHGILHLYCYVEWYNSQITLEQAQQLVFATCKNVPPDASCSNNIPDIVSCALQQEIRECLINHSDASIMTVLLLAGATTVPIQQHVGLTATDCLSWYSTLLPACPCLETFNSPINVMWVQTRQGGPLSHIIPLSSSSDESVKLISVELPVLEDSNVCCGSPCTEKIWCNDNTLGKKIHWIQCELCQKWYHTFCVGLRNMPCPFTCCDLSSINIKLFVFKYNVDCKPLEWKSHDVIAVNRMVDLTTESVSLFVWHLRKAAIMPAGCEILPPHVFQLSRLATSLSLPDMKKDILSIVGTIPTKGLLIPCNLWDTHWVLLHISNHFAVIFDPYCNVTDEELTCIQVKAEAINQCLYQKELENIKLQTGMGDEGICHGPFSGDYALYMLMKIYDKSVKVKKVPTVIRSLIKFQGALEETLSTEKFITEWFKQIEMI